MSIRIHPESETHTVAGRRIALRRIPARRADAPVLVFLHEGLGSVELWRDVPDVLAERTGCGAVVYSRYGNGFSEILHEPRTLRYMHDEALVSLPALLECCGIAPERAVLVGHSDGASIALIYAGSGMASPAGVVLEAPHLFVERRSLRGIAEAKRRFLDGDLRARMMPYHADADATFSGWNDIWLSPAFREWNIEEYVARVTCPVLAIQGADDAYGTLRQLQRLRRLARGSVDTLVLAACGHDPHRERRELVLAAITGWLAGLVLGGIDSSPSPKRV
jgi:pimeloyl-ACP methyl ester carboxylesterase